MRSAAQKRQRPLWERALSVVSQSAGESAVVGAGCYARNIRPIEADVGQFAIAKLGQLVDIALIVPERLDHADEREQHGSLLVIAIQPLEGRLIVEMNIAQFLQCRSSNGAVQLILKCMTEVRND